jgi:hypothetical protein
MYNFRNALIDGEQILFPSAVLPASGYEGIISVPQNTPKA